jgi:hypothetical protein
MSCYYPSLQRRGRWGHADAVAAVVVVADGMRVRRRCLWVVQGVERR